MGASSWPRGIRSATSVVSVRDRSPSAGGRCRTSAIDVPGEAVGTEGLCGSLLKACQSQVRGVPKGPSSCRAIAPVRCQRTDARVHARTLAACSRSCRESHGGDAAGEAPEDRPGGACDEASAGEERGHAEDEPSPPCQPEEERRWSLLETEDKPFKTRLSRRQGKVARWRGATSLVPSKAGTAAARTRGRGQRPGPGWNRERLQPRAGRTRGRGARGGRVAGRSLRADSSSWLTS